MLAEDRAEKGEKTTCFITAADGFIDTISTVQFAEDALLSGNAGRCALFVVSVTSTTNVRLQ